ncbi:hypothetical protein K8O92_04815 [Nocardia asteroides]|nr:hypothetical protein CRM89_10255 [Nocardia sp. FDAARGOS_372]UAK33312.1 hypothetical protein K8O92_04815 [Nocardia asteroides]
MVKTQWSDRAGIEARTADSTRGEDLAMAATSVWIVVAVHLDGRAHYLDLPDSFFTWWHLLLYSGVGAAAALLLAMGVRRRNAGRSLMSAAVSMPRGYGWSLAGVGVFSAAGAADMAWHLRFGVESGLDALVSPTHLLLFTGAVLLFSGPLRAIQIKQPSAPAWAPPAVIAAAAITGIIGFALSYVSAFTTDAPLRAVEDFPEGTPEHYATEIPAQAGLGAYLITTVLVVVPIALLLKRRRLPVGAITAIVTGLAVLAQTVQNFTRPSVVVAAVIAGLIIEGLVAVSTAWVPRVPTAAMVAVVLPAALWSVQFVALQLGPGVAWSAELTAGTVVLSALVSVALVSALGARKA